MFFLRIYRALPLVIALAIIGLIVYLITLYRFSRPRAQEVMLKFFLWSNGILSAVLLIATLYALFEENTGVFEFMGSCFVLFFIFLAITLVARYRFLKRNPEYRIKAQRTSDPNSIIEIIKRVFFKK